MLLGAVVLGLLAVAGVWSVMQPGQSGPAAEAPRNHIVVAADAIAFGKRIEAAKLKTIPWPGEMPAHAYRKVADAVQDGRRTALRNFAAGEPVLGTSISGELGRLASSSQLGADMRAVSIAIDEVSGAGGFVAPGDRVDVLVTQGGRDEPAVNGLVAQNLRVLATGQMQDPSSSEPRLVKSLTLEASPEDARRILLARPIGALDVMLRGTGDDSPLVASEMNSLRAFGIRPPRQQSAGAAAPQAAADGPAVVMVARRGPEVAVVRGTEATSYRVAK